MHTSRNFISKKGHLGRLDWKFGKDVHWIPYRKHGIRLSGFVVVMFSFGEIPRRPSDSSSSHLKNSVFGYTCGFSGTKPNRLKQDFFSAASLVRCLKNQIGIFGRASSNWGTQTSLSSMKILEESPWQFLNFAVAKCQFDHYRPIKKIKKNGLYAACEGCPYPTNGIAHSKQRQDALSYFEVRELELWCIFRLLLAFIGVSFLLSMWISNTGVVVMLLPIIFAIQKELLSKELSTETVLETVKVQPILNENDDFSASGKDYYYLLHRTLGIKSSRIQLLDSKVD